ncbi:Hypothetical predicted protein [Xyrichtys novacula]|uniref:Uncharacterized protein n=1 Tax=Xyrichtys novacula TaxID=13765 RepID=A0AAV1GHJ9_XYRNO|nr:Hypothetical predicted protein [Xyrichtys novacula]
MATKAALHIAPLCVILERVNGPVQCSKGKKGAPHKSATVNELLMDINPKQRDGAETNVRWHEFRRDGQHLKESRAAWQLHTAVS